MFINADLSGGPGRLREIIEAGEPLNPEVIEQVHKAWGLQLRDGTARPRRRPRWGTRQARRWKPGSMGRPLPGMPVVLVDPVTGERVSATGGRAW